VLPLEKAPHGRSGRCRAISRVRLRFAGSFHPLSGLGDRLRSVHVQSPTPLRSAARYGPSQRYSARKAIRRFWRRRPYWLLWSCFRASICASFLGGGTPDPRALWECGSNSHVPPAPTAMARLPSAPFGTTQGIPPSQSRWCTAHHRPRLPHIPPSIPTEAVFASAPARISLAERRVVTAHALTDRHSGHSSPLHSAPSRMLPRHTSCSAPASPLPFATLPELVPTPSRRLLF
jgi:hypothetical protein